MTHGVFVTGTDTGVGKTWFAGLLLKRLLAQGLRAAGFKPFCCGDREDALCLASAGAEGDVNRVNPFWFQAPVSPLAAAMLENRPPDLSLVRQAFQHLASQYDVVVAEGAGGWLVPISQDYTMADLAMEFALPVVVVVANRLGCLNHTLLTLADLRRRGATCLGLVVNEIAPPSDDPARTTNPALLDMLAGVPVIARLPYRDPEGAWISPGLLAALGLRENR
ncbi:MAG: dethiobiotin synthase [Verrucomicrobiia bacterium]